MKPRSGIVGLGLALLGGCASSSESLATYALRQAPNLVAIAYLDLDGDEQILVEADAVLHAASTMKIAVMIEAFRQADRGEIDLDAPVVLRNEFRSIVDGSSYALSPPDDSDPELYARLGQAVTWRELVRRMIDVSSNLATNVVLERVGAERTQRTIESLGTSRMQVRRGVEDQKAFDRGLNNVTTARDLMLLLAAIARDQAASPASCQAMRDILLGQRFNDLIPKGLPPGTRVAHKTGEITRHQHDAAIVYPASGGPYVLVVLTKGWDKPEASARVIAEVAAIAYGRR